jgi:hypothetical protein
MGAPVIESEERVFIEGIPRLAWGKGADCSFVRSAQLALNALGDTCSYAFLMGISGAAFRLHFHPDWCPSMGDATTGFDVSRVLFPSLGYRAELVSINDKSFEEIRSLCRTYFDKAEEYSLADHAPWLSFFIMGKGTALPEEELYRNSFRIAVQQWETERFGKYLSGEHAYLTWIGDLEKASHAAGKAGFPHHEANLTLFRVLADSRRAARRYMEEAAAFLGLKERDAILARYDALNGLLSHTLEETLPGFGEGLEAWTSAILSEQARVLEEVMETERKIIGILNNEWNTA